MLHNDPGNNTTTSLGRGRTVGKNKIVWQSALLARDKREREKCSCFESDSASSASYPILSDWKGQN